MTTHNETPTVFKQGLLAALLTVLGWAAVASMMFAQDHAVVSAGMLLPAGLSIGLMGAYLAAPAVARSQRPGRSARPESSHIHIQRPARGYFSPYACCAGNNTNKGGHDDDCRTH